MDRSWYHCNSCNLVFEDESKDGKACPKCKSRVLHIPPLYRNKAVCTDDTFTYLWLDVIKRDLIKDSAHDCMINAIEKAQQLIREKVTGFIEENNPFKSYNTGNGI